MGRRNFDPEYKLRAPLDGGGRRPGCPAGGAGSGYGGGAAVRRSVERLKADRSGEAGDGRHLTRKNAGCGN